MASAPTSSLRYRRQDGQVQSAPKEWTLGFVEILVPPETWSQIRLTRHGVELSVSLRRLGEETVVVAEWPRSGTGHYELVCETAEGREVATWTVAPHKLDRDAYERLFDDLEQLPVSIVIALQRLGAHTGIKLTPPSETTTSQELLRLERAIRGTELRPGLAKVLQALSSDPHAILETHQLWVQADRARRIHPSELARAYIQGHNLDADGRPLRVPDTRVEHTVDVYENRLLRAFHDELGHRLRRLRRRFLASGKADVLSTIDELANELRRARLQAAFLDEVGLPRHLPTRLTMVLLRRPEYRAALEGFLELRRSASVRLEEPALDAPLTELPVLYETWGTLRVLEALLRAAAQLGYRLELERLLYRDATGFFVELLQSGDPTVVLRHNGLRRTVRLIPQATYGSGARLHSASYRQQPDIAVEIKDDDGEHRLLLFDPKYKLDSEEVEGEITDARPKKVDIDKMHAYRDAIRDAEDQRVVSYAAILYPGPTEPSFGTGIGALSAVPGQTDELDAYLDALLRAELHGTEQPVTSAA